MSSAEESDAVTAVILKHFAQLSKTINGYANVPGYLRAALDLNLR